MTRLAVMVTAFVLIGAERGYENDLVRDLKKTPNVDNVYVVYGIYDIVVKVVAETIERLKETITWKIRRLDKIRSTLTLIVITDQTS